MCYLSKAIAHLREAVIDKYGAMVVVVGGYFMTLSLAEVYSVDLQDGE
jgi:hypothetical protein